MSNLEKTSAIDHKTISVLTIGNNSKISVVESNTPCMFVRKRKLMWILFSIIVTILIVLAITIPIVLTSKKQTDANTSTISTITITNITSNTNTTTIMKTTTETKISLPNIPKWKKNATTVAGGNLRGDALNQLSFPYSIYVDDDDDDETIYIAELGNHRIVEWKRDATNGKIVAGGNGFGNEDDQLGGPSNVIVDKENDSFIICDLSNEKVVRWSRRNGTHGKIIIPNIACFGLTMDNKGYLYVSDQKKHEVRRWGTGDTIGTIVAGGNGKGDRFDQLNHPSYIFVDRDRSVYVSDAHNYRVMKWTEGAKEGVVVIQGQNRVGRPTQIATPNSVIVDYLDNIYVADTANSRVMRWINGSAIGNILLGGNKLGTQPDQLSFPVGLSFDRHGNLYVVDQSNFRVQKFYIDSD